MFNGVRYCVAAKWVHQCMQCMRAQNCLDGGRVVFEQFRKILQSESSGFMLRLLRMYMHVPVYVSCLLSVELVLRVCV